MDTVETLSRELNENLIDRITKLGIERLLYTEPRIYESRLGRLLSNEVVCKIGRGNVNMLALVIRINENDNEYVYRYIYHIINGHDTYDDMVKDIIRLSKKERHNRTLFEKEHWSCFGCVSYRGEDNLCFKDCQGIGNHPDFPCVLHEMRPELFEANNDT